MHNKRLNNNLTNSISKGGVLYRAGEIPALTKEQIEQAKLVSKLPKDFPFAQWDNMYTKQQLQQMKHSGLNDQDQWSLLNTNVPLSVLNQHNQAQAEVETRASATRIAATLMNAAAQTSASRTQATVGKSTVSTPLQKGQTSGKLGKENNDLLAKIKNTSSSLSATKGTQNGFRAAGEGITLAPTLNADQAPSPTTTPNPDLAPTPNPNQTPLPKPGPSLDTFGIDTHYLSEESRKQLYYILSKLDTSAPPELYRTYLKELENIRLEEEKGKYFEKIKSGAPADATWGTEMIYDQRVYNKISGTFGPWGNIPENVCGAAAIQNANQILGINTRFDELIYSIQKEYLVTTNLFGKLGMSIDALCGYYINAGATVTDYDSHSKIPNNHDAYIVMYVYKDTNGNLGAHYVAAGYDEIKDCFKVYNDLDPNKPEEWEALLPSSYLKIAAKSGHNDKILGWNVFGIGQPKQPQVKISKRTAAKTRVTTVSKSKWIRMSK